MENRALPKRFYAAADVAACEGDFAITLDGKNVRTPQQKLLRTNSKKLVQQIAEEWNAQAEVIDTDTMPLTRLLNIALDRVEADRSALLADIAGYLETDLLCYRAPLQNDALPIDSPNEQLRALQVQHFDPILDWVKRDYAAAFITTDGLMPVPQPQASIEKMASLFAAANDQELAALAMLVPLLGSALLTLALWQGFVDVEAALTAARLDESVQAEAWGEDTEVAHKWAAKCRDIRACAVFLDCARP